VVQFFVQPLVLTATENQALLKLTAVPAMLLLRSGADLVIAVLACIQQVHPEQLAVIKTPVHLDAAIQRSLRTANRHVLVPGLQGSGTTDQEGFGIAAILFVSTSPDAIDFFIVIAAHEGG